MSDTSMKYTEAFPIFNDHFDTWLTSSWATTGPLVGTVEANEITDAFFNEAELNVVARVINYFECDSFNSKQLHKTAERFKQAGLGDIPLYMAECSNRLPIKLLIGSNEIEFVYIPAPPNYIFRIGLDDDEIKEAIISINDDAPEKWTMKDARVDEFYIATTEFSAASFYAFLEANPAYEPMHPLRTSPPSSTDSPAVDITYNDVLALVKWLNETQRVPAGFEFAVPTEAQWEYAASRGDTRTLPAGTNPDKAFRHFPCFVPEGKNLSDVAIISPLTSGSLSRPASLTYDGCSTIDGALNMVGNVWEYVEPYGDINLVGEKTALAKGGGYSNKIPIIMWRQSRFLISSFDANAFVLGVRLVLSRKK